MAANPRRSRRHWKRCVGEDAYQIFVVAINDAEIPHNKPRSRDWRLSGTKRSKTPHESNGREGLRSKSGRKWMEER